MFRQGFPLPSAKPSVSEGVFGKLDPEDGGRTFFRNIGNYLLVDTVLELQSWHGEVLLSINHCLW